MIPVDVLTHIYSFIPIDNTSINNVALVNKQAMTLFSNRFYTSIRTLPMFKRFFYNDFANIVDFMNTVNKTIKRYQLLKTLFTLVYIMARGNLRELEMVISEHHNNWLISRLSSISVETDRQVLMENFQLCRDILIDNNRHNISFIDIVAEFFYDYCEAKTAEMFFRRIIQMIDFYEATFVWNNFGLGRPSTYQLLCDANILEYFRTSCPTLYIDHIEDKEADDPIIGSIIDALQENNSAVIDFWLYAFSFDHQLFSYDDISKFVNYLTNAIGEFSISQRRKILCLQMFEKKL